MIKQLLAGLASVAVIGGVATVSFAQTTETKTATNPNTKVYSYQKTIEQKKADPGIARSNNSPSEHLIGSVPFGSPKWWEIQGRTTGGEQ
jgi:hypothetical protein